jgi:hypothetical protein
MEISFLFFLHRRADKNCIARRCGDFVIDDQSRIAGVCREIRSLDFLELTLCSNWRQRKSFRSGCERPWIKRHHIALHTSIRRSQRTDCAIAPQVPLRQV